MIFILLIYSTMFMKKYLCYRLFHYRDLARYSFRSDAQKVSDTLPPVATVDACVQFALKHYPLVQQAMLDEQITDRQIKSRLAEWYPQIGLKCKLSEQFSVAGDCLQWRL